MWRPRGLRASPYPVGGSEPDAPRTTQLAVVPYERHCGLAVERFGRRISGMAPDTSQFIAVNTGALGGKDQNRITHSDHPERLQATSACFGWPSRHGPLMSSGVTGR
jgi:hypothetical protein